MGLLETTLKILGYAILVSSLIWSGWELKQEIGGEEKQQLLQQFKENPEQVGTQGTLFFISYEMITPAYKFKEWIGNQETSIIWLEEIPFLKSKDMLFIAPVWILIISYNKYFWNTSDLGPLLKGLSSIGIFLAGTILAWIFFKTLFFIIMKITASNLELAHETVTQIREDRFEATKEIVGIKNFLILTVISSFIIIRGVISGNET